MVSEWFQRGLKLCGFRGVLADAVAKRYRPWPKGLRTDSLPWFDSPLVQGASRLRYTDKAQMQRPGHTGRKALATKKKKCGFRGVSEWSETVWFQSGFRVVAGAVV